MPLKSSKSNRDIQSIHSAPKMRPTALKMAKNQGLDSVLQNKKNKNKKFREKAAERHVSIYRDAPMRKGKKITPNTGTRCVSNMSLFVTYGITPNKVPPPRGATDSGDRLRRPLRRRLRRRLRRPIPQRAKRLKADGLHAPKRTTDNGGRTSPKSPIIPLNNSLLITYI